MLRTEQICKWRDGHVANRMRLYTLCCLPIANVSALANCDASFFFFFFFKLAGEKVALGCCSVFQEMFVPLDNRTRVSVYRSENRFGVCCLRRRVLLCYCLLLLMHLFHCSVHLRQCSLHVFLHLEREH